MKRILKKFSLMFIMALSIALGSFTCAFAADSTYTDNLIPKMTSNTAPSGVANSSSPNSDYAPYQAFSRTFYGAYGSYWMASSKSVPQWISYKFDTPKSICKYTMTYINYASDLTRAPRDWLFQGSNDGINWITLDSQSGMSFTAGEKKTFTFNNSTNYLSYRIYITAINGSTYYGAVIDEIEMMEKVQSNATSISLDKSSMDLNVGNSQQLTATTTPAGAALAWTSSDSNVAIVDPTGKVAGVKEGTCTITATTANGLTATCAVTVTTKTAEPTNPVPDPSDSENIVNIAHAKGDNTNNAGGDVTIIFHGAADTTLSVVKTADVKEVWVGDNFTYTIVVTNTGTKTAKAVVVNDPAPNHIDFLVNGVTSTQGKIDPSSTSKNIIVNVGDIAPGATATIKIPATVIL